MAAIDAAEENDVDWTSADGAKGFYYIDGKNIINIPELAQAVVRAKQSIPLIVGGDFSKWDFRNQQTAMSGICFYQTNLSGSNWAGVDAFGNGYIDANLEDANFAKTKIEYVLLSTANLSRTNMRGANLAHGRMDGGWNSSVEGLDLSNADMRAFMFDCGIMIDDGCALDRNGVKLQGANLQGADISTFPLWEDGVYASANINGTVISPRQIGDLAQAKISGKVILRGGDVRVALTPKEWTTLTAASAADKDAPSFDCAKATSDMEKLICAESSVELRQRDRKMARLYASAKAINPAVVASQKTWLASRGDCIDDLCLLDSYDKRIDALAAIVAKPPLAKDALYIDDIGGSNDAFRSTALFKKITPALVGASMAEIVLTRNANGSYTARGSAVGANAHTCTLSADGMRLNATTGWLGIGKAPVVRVIGDDIDVVANGHPYEQYPDSEEYVSCGARAIFDTLHRIEVDAKTLAKEKRVLAEGNGE